MKVLIVEDEPFAAAQLAAHLTALRPGSEIVAVCDTVKSTVEWLGNNPAPDLSFFDIHLGDGLCFEIFEQKEFNSPVIFTTAYDQYAIRAFKVNSIDYLLKPVDRGELEKALNKYEQVSSPKTSPMSPEILEELVVSLKTKNYKERFLIKVGTHLRIIDINEILYFYSFQKGTFLKTADGKDYLTDQSLELIEEIVDPALFFRINRKYLVKLTAINEAVAYSNSRLKLKVKQGSQDDFLVAREKVKTFKSWLEGE